jgi:hypothetical protein
MPAPDSRQRPDQVRAWLEQQPSLTELQERYPQEWGVVQRELADIVPRGDLEELKAYVRSIAAPPVVQGRKPARGLDPGLAAEIRRQMAAAAIKQLSLSAATGVHEGRVRFNVVNGWVAQKLLFEEGLRRKPVSLPAFRVVWPLLWQRRFLMPLVGPRGIYCFYSKPLIRKLAALVGDRPALEIAAGDGTLARFLAGAGVDITPTDDHSWRDVSFPAEVVRQDARAAVRERRPAAVVCSWPPAGNDFEREVFRTASVELYVVVGSRHRFATGNWDAYEEQTDFELAEEPELSRLVLPPELDAAVYVFRRTT